MQKNVYEKIIYTENKKESGCVQFVCYCGTVLMHVKLIVFVTSHCETNSNHLNVALFRMSAGKKQLFGTMAISYHMYT